MSNQVSEDERELLDHLLDHDDDLELVMAKVPNLSTAALHEFFLSYNWDTGTEPLSLAMDLPHLDRSTALAIYWLGEPDHWAGNEFSNDYHGKDAHNLYLKTEDRLVKDSFVSRSISYDIRADQGGIDAYWDGIAENPHIPESLKPPQQNPT